MKKLLLLTSILLLVACTPGGTTTDIQQFIGGTSGLAASFEPNTPPSEAFDGGFAPFDVVVRLENKGEEAIKPAHAKVTISGVLEPEFNLKNGDLTQKVTEELSPIHKDATGKTVAGNPVFVEFKNFNHVSTITGNALDFPLRADVCYSYATHASSLACSRANILNPEANGICEIAGDKPVANSGAPVQVSNVKQAARSANSITLSFDITHSGTGRVFGLESGCDKTQRKYADNVDVTVETGVPGLSCSRLQGESSNAHGNIAIYGGTATITCTQTLDHPTDAVVPVTITLGYDYEQTVETKITIKHAGE
jgi:hypothetical protein